MPPQAHLVLPLCRFPMKVTQTKGPEPLPRHQPLVWPSPSRVLGAWWLPLEASVMLLAKPTCLWGVQQGRQSWEQLAHRRPGATDGLVLPAALDFKATPGTAPWAPN